MTTTSLPPPSRLALYLNLIRWDRPAGSYLLLWPSLSALWLAADGFPGWKLLGIFIAGTFLMRSAGCAVNDVADLEFDRHVKRTAHRPITSGQLSIREGLLFGAALAMLAFVLVLFTNLATVVWSVAALLISIAYPYAKRLVAMPQAVLGIAFSFGIPMAYAAVRGGSDWSWASVPDAVPAVAAWILAGNLFWVLAYDTEYAMVDRDDDLNLDIKTSAITLGRFDVAAVMGFYAIHLLAWALIGRHLGLTWPFFAALLGAAGIAGWHFSLIKDRTRDGCFKAFSLNHWLGLVIFIGVAVAVQTR